MRVLMMAQYSPAFWEARCGLPTASCFHRILQAKSGKPSKGRLRYILELCEDRENPSAPFVTERQGHTAAMRNGINWEPDARRWYEMERECVVTQVGFCVSDDGRCGCSPDGLVKDVDGDWEGGLELKCPDKRNHEMRVYKNEGLPLEHKLQVHGSMVVTGLNWWDFMSFHPNVEKKVLVRVHRDDFTDTLEASLNEFWQEYDKVSKEKLGQPAPGMNRVEFFMARDAFDEWYLRNLTDPELAVDGINASLPRLAEMNLVGPVKAYAWDKICQLAQKNAWEYDQDERKFRVPENPPF